MDSGHFVLPADGAVLYTRAGQRTIVFAQFSGQTLNDYFSNTLDREILGQKPANVYRPQTCQEKVAKFPPPSLHPAGS